MTDTRSTKPEKSRRTPRQVIFHIRLTAQELRELERKAKAEYMPVSSWARKVLLASEEKAPWEE